MFLFACISQQIGLPLCLPCSGFMAEGMFWAVLSEMIYWLSTCPKSPIVSLRPLSIGLLLSIRIPHRLRIVMPH